MRHKQVNNHTIENNFPNVCAYPKAEERSDLGIKKEDYSVILLGDVETRVRDSEATLKPH